MTHPALVPALAWLDQRIASDTSLSPALFDQLLIAERDQGLLHGTRPLCPFLRPHILHRSQYQAISDAAEALATAFEHLAAVALQNPHIMARLGLRPKEETMARLDPGYPRLCVTSRLDTFCTDTGFQFLEYNAETPAGISDQALMSNIFFKLPHLREFLEKFPHWIPDPQTRLLRALVEAYRAWGGSKEKPHIGIVDWRGVPTWSEFEVLKIYFESQGYPTVICDPHELEYDNQVLRYGDFAIDIFYKRVIIHEFLEKFDETHPLVRAYAGHRVCMINSFRAKIAHKKAGFAILSDEQFEHLFTPEQVQVFRNHIPWTRLVQAGKSTHKGETIDLLDFISQNRSHLVLKPSDDYGGHGVVIGWDVDQSAWEAAIKLAIDHDYVVQERVPVQKIKIPLFTDRIETHELLVDFDPYLFNNQVEGGMVRLAATSLVNVSSGGGEAPLLILE
ncbi:MAG: hypothetical protein HY774_03820 [Acidobacteria bacterium]|nr:hypothetical protein [Acidobacteriota bacterium]